ncbi:MAG: cytidylate kinase family protein [bacterium]
MSIITLSRGSKSGGLALAELLGKKLPCSNLVSREILVKASEEYGVTEKELTAAMERPPGFWERSAGNPRRLYLAFIRAALLDFASKGCVVFHGHAGHFLLSDVPWVLKVRLIAPMEQRIAVLQQTTNMDRYEAEQYINKVDEDRKRWIRFLYNVDWNDPAHFDVVVNLRTMSLETASDLICALVASSEFARTPERESDLRDKALAARVYAEIEKNPKTRGNEIEVSAEGETISLRGKIASEAIQSSIIEAARAVSGVQQVNDHLSSY